MRNNAMTLFIVCGETQTGSQGAEVISRAGDSTPISRVINDCLSMKKASNLRPSYLKNLRIYWKGFASGRENQCISTFGLRALEDWFSEQKEKPVTKRGNIARMSVLFQFAWRRGWIKENPCFRLDRPRVDHKPPLIFAPLEVRTLLRYLQANEKRRWRLAQVILGLFAGIRPTELTRLHWSDVDLVKGIVRIDAAASKVRRRRIVPLSENAVAWLKLCAQHKKPIGSKRGKWMRAMQLITGLKWHPDILRHSAASYLLAKHEDVSKVSRWLGNSPEILLRHYAELVSAEDSAAFWSIVPANEKLPDPEH